MQLLLDYAATDPAAWQAGFEARSGTRGQAGLTVLQIWRQDAPAGLLCLFQVNDRKRAEAWLEVETALHGAGTARFLETL